MHFEIEIKQNTGVVRLDCGNMDYEFAHTCGCDYACSIQTENVMGIDCPIMSDDYDELCRGCAIYTRLLRLKEDFETKTDMKVKLFN